MLIGIAIVNDHPLYPIIQSSATQSMSIKITCNITLEAIFTFFFIEFITVIHV